MRVVTSDHWLADRARAAGAIGRARVGVPLADRRRLMVPDDPLRAAAATRASPTRSPATAPSTCCSCPAGSRQIEHLWEAPAMRRFLERLAVVRPPDPVRPPRHGPLGSAARRPHARAGRRRTRSPCSTPPAANARRCSPTRWAAPWARQLAAEHPQRVGALIMYASVARTTWAPDYDWAMTPRNGRKLTRAERRHMGRGRQPGARACWRRRWPGTRCWLAGSRACSASPRAPPRRA